MFLSILLLLSILAGQLLKFPTSGSQGPILLDCFIIIFCFYSFFKLRFKLNKPPVFIKFGFIFVFLQILSLIFTPLHLSFPEYFSSFSYSLRFILYLTAGWIITTGAFNKFKQEIPVTLLRAGVGIAILGILQFIFIPDLKFLAEYGWDPHYFRTVSTFLDPNFTGSFLVLTFILLFSYKDKKAYFIFAAIVVYLALLTTFSRSSYLMFAVSGLTLSILKKSRQIFLIFIILFLGLLLGFYSYNKSVTVSKKIDRTQSAQARLSTWQMGLTLFSAHPLLGVGFNAYKYALNEYHLAPEEFTKSHGASSNDSSLLFVLATTGILGLISYLLFLFTAVKTNIKKSSLLIAGTFGLIIDSFFTNSLFYPPLLLWFILMAI